MSITTTMHPDAFHRIAAALKHRADTLAARAANTSRNVSKDVVASRHQAAQVAHEDYMAFVQGRGK